MDVRGSFPEEEHAFKEERHADGGDEGREPWRIAQRPVGDPLDGHVENTADEHRDHEHDHEREGGAGTERLAFGQAEDRDERSGEEGPEGEDVAMREIDELDDAVDHRVAERDERVDPAVRQREGEDLQEERGSLVVDPLNEQDAEEPDEQDEPGVEDEAGAAAPQQASPLSDRLPDGPHSSRL